MKFSEKAGNGPMNTRLNFGHDTDQLLDTGIVFRIRHYREIRKVVSTDCAARRCSARHALAGVAIATVASLRHRPTTDVPWRRYAMHCPSASNYDFITRLLPSLTMIKRTLESVNIWRNYGQKYSDISLTHHTAVPNGPVSTPLCKNRAHLHTIMFVMRYPCSQLNIGHFSQKITDDVLIVHCRHWRHHNCKFRDGVDK